MSLPNGQNAMDFYTQNDLDETSMDNMVDHNAGRSGTGTRSSSYAGKRIRTKTSNTDFVDITKAQISSDEDDPADRQVKRRRLVQSRISLRLNSGNHNHSRSRSRLDFQDQPQDSSDEENSQSDSSLDGRQNTRVTRSSISTLQTKAALQNHGGDSDIDELAKGNEIESEDSAIVYTKQRTKKDAQQSQTTRSKFQPSNRNSKPRSAMGSDSSILSDVPVPTRRSGRTHATKSMKERDMNEEIFADDSETIFAPKIISIREVFQPNSKHTRFGLAHRSDCEVCGGYGNSSDKGTSPLIYCQGCCTSIHKLCLGYRGSREHIVTKIGPENFVLQCRRCIGIANKKDTSAPRLDKCTVCRETGAACVAFSQKKTSKQEEKLREENEGADPITEVKTTLINNDANVLFRCRECHRGWHLEHLPSANEDSETPDDQELLRDHRLKEYTPKWLCNECINAPAKAQILAAWRPIDKTSYVAGRRADQLSEDEKEYLVKWANKSYFQCSWMPGAWVWGVTAAAMRKAFVNRNEGANLLPKWTTQESIQKNGCGWILSLTSNTTRDTFPLLKLPTKPILTISRGFSLSSKDLDTMKLCGKSLQPQMSPNDGETLCQPSRNILQEDTSNNSQRTP